MSIQDQQYAKKWRRIDRLALWGVGVLAAGILGYILFVLFGGFNMIEQNKMSAYLKDKYGKEFIVTNVRREGYGIGVKGTMFGDARPKDGSSEMFFVREGAGVYWDGYVSRAWEKQQQSAFNAYIDNLHIKPTRNEVDITISESLSRTFTTVPPIESTLSSYGKEVVFGVKVIVVGDTPNETVLDDVNQLINYVKGVNKKNYAVRYVINSDSKDSRYYCQYYGGESRHSIYSQSDLIKCFNYSEGRE